MNAPDCFHPTPGIVAGLGSEDYHRMPAMNASGLKSLRRSPAHYYGQFLDPARPRTEPTPAMRNGTLVHCALFEPFALSERYAVKPDGHDGRTAAGKAWAASVDGMEIVSADQMAAAVAQSSALHSLPDIAALLEHGEPEQSAFWIDEDTGDMCKCRPDWVSPAGDGVIIVDGKTCIDASPDGFAKAVINWSYHLQAAWYCDGYAAATGKTVHGFVFAAVENTWPYAAAAYMLGDDVMDAARREIRRLMRTYTECKKSGVWPGYGPGINLLNLPAWAKLETQE